MMCRVLAAVANPRCIVLRRAWRSGAFRLEASVRDMQSRCRCGTGERMAHSNGRCALTCRSAPAGCSLQCASAGARRPLLRVASTHSRMLRVAWRVVARCMLCDARRASNVARRTLCTAGHQRHGGLYGASESAVALWHRGRDAGASTSMGLSPSLLVGGCPGALASAAAAGPCGDTVPPAPAVLRSTGLPIGGAVGGAFSAPLWRPGGGAEGGAPWGLGAPHLP